MADVYRVQTEPLFAEPDVNLGNTHEATLTIIDQVVLVLAKYQINIFLQPMWTFQFLVAPVCSFESFPYILFYVAEMIYQAKSLLTKRQI